MTSYCMQRPRAGFGERWAEIKDNHNKRTIVGAGVVTFGR